MSRAWLVRFAVLLLVVLVAGFLLAVGGRALPRALVSTRPETQAAVALVRLFAGVEIAFKPLTWLLRMLLRHVSDEAIPMPILNTCRISPNGDLFKLHEP